MTDNTLVFLDVETTGLNPGLHEIWEIAYAVDDGPIDASGVTHNTASADPAALRMNGYRDRAARGQSIPAIDFEETLREALTGATLVAANPAFDAAFLRVRWGVTPWLYRMIDLETYAMPALGLDRPKGLAYIAEQLGVPAPDHSAAGDVAALRACYRVLQAGYAALRGDLPDPRDAEEPAQDLPGALNGLSGPPKGTSGPAEDVR